MPPKPFPTQAGAPHSPDGGRCEPQGYWRTMTDPERGLRHLWCVCVYLFLAVLFLLLHANLLSLQQVGATLCCSLKQGSGFSLQ